jgi:CheY-like chemotaxis protein
MNEAGGRTILVVDDDVDVTEAVTAALTDEGYEVVTAANGHEALVYLKSEKPLPSLILLDVMMPIMDGYEFRREQSRDPAISGIPVLVCTAGAPGECLAAMGDTGRLRKPFDLDQLLGEVASRA